MPGCATILACTGVLTSAEGEGHRVVPTIRLAHRGDLAQLVATYNYYIEHSIATFDTEPTTVEDRAAWFETFSEVGPYRLLVACDNDRVLGCASSYPQRTRVDGSGAVFRRSPLANRGGDLFVVKQPDPTVAAIRWVSTNCSNSGLRKASPLLHRASRT